MGDAIRDIGDEEFSAAARCRLHAPAWLNAVAVTNGFLPRRLDGEFAWADFSCGDGVGAAALAAANPEGRFFALGDGARGRVLAEKSGLSNIFWLSGDLADLPDDALPPLDFAVFDGGLAALGEKGREAALARIARAVKPGGILLVGYHALPGFAAMMPLRDVLHSLAAKGPQTPATRVRAAFDWLDREDAAGTGFLAEHAGVRRRLAALAACPPEDAAAELFAPTLTPFHFAQVEGSLTRHGFSFAGNARIFLNMLDLALPSAAHPLLKGARSRREFETLRDVLRNPFHRRDVYVRGAAVADEAAFWAQHDSLVIGLARSPDRVDFGGHVVDFRGFPFVPLCDALAEALSFADAVPLASPVAGAVLPLDRTEALVLSNIVETGCGFADAEDTVLARLTPERLPPGRAWAWCRDRPGRPGKPGKLGRGAAPDPAGDSVPRPHS